MKTKALLTRVRRISPARKVVREIDAINQPYDKKRLGATNYHFVPPHNPKTLIL